MHQNQHRSSRISQRYAVPSSVWLKETLEYQCCVYGELGLWVLALGGYFVIWWKETWSEPTEAADRWDFEYDMTQSSSSGGAKFTNIFMSSYHFPSLCIAWDTPLEVQNSGHVPLAVCCVRESGETEATCFASPRLQMPKSRDWHFPMVLPLGGIIQGCVACWAAAMSGSIYWSLLQGYMFSRPHQEAKNPAKKSSW